MTMAVAAIRTIAVVAARISVTLGELETIFLMGEGMAVLSKELSPTFGQPVQLG